MEPDFSPTHDRSEKCKLENNEYMERQQIKNLSYHLRELPPSTPPGQTARKSTKLENDSMFPNRRAWLAHFFPQIECWFSMRNSSQLSQLRNA